MNETKTWLIIALCIVSVILRASIFFGWNYFQSIERNREFVYRATILNGQLRNLVEAEKRGSRELKSIRDRARDRLDRERSIIDQTEYFDNRERERIERDRESLRIILDSGSNFEKCLESIREAAIRGQEITSEIRTWID